MITIIVDKSSMEAEEFAAWLDIQPGIKAWVELPGRHSAGEHQVIDFDGDEDELLRNLWGKYCKS